MSNPTKPCEYCGTEIVKTTKVSAKDWERKRFCSFKCRGHAYSPVKNTEETFWALVDKSGDCWIWKGTPHRKYGQYKLGGRSWGAHRISYKLLVGEIPAGMELDHLCRNTLCVNPAHLEPVTPMENKLRAPNYTANRTHCPQGHEYNESNTYFIPTGGRGCRTCRNRNDKKYKAKLKRASGIEGKQE